MAKFKPYFEVSIPKDYTPEERRAIAAEIIDHVIARTENGIDASGKKFAKYSKMYAKEKGQTNVDLTFSGEMLSEIQLLQSKNGSVRIGYDSDSEIVGKVEGNILGTYGQDGPVKGKARNFLGLTKAEVNNILSNYPVRDKESRKDRVDQIKESDLIASEILRRSGFEVDDDT